MSLNLQKIPKNRQISHFFEGEISFNVGRVFWPRAEHTIKKYFEYPQIITLEQK